MRFDVSVIGALNADLIVRGDAPLDFDALQSWSSAAQIDLLPGGSVGYTVSAFARMALQTCVSSCIADDAFGAMVADSLRDLGVDVSMVQRVPGSVSGLAVYMLLFGSRKRPLVYRLPTHPFWQTSYTPADVDRLLDARALHLGGYLHFEDAWHGEAVDLFHEAQQRGVITSLDPQFPVADMGGAWLPALDDLLPSVDYLFCDDDEALRLTGETDLNTAAETLLRAGVRTVVVKRGARGSTVYKDQDSLDQPQIDVGELVDTIGAGDVYNAGFLYGVLQGWDLSRSARFASLAAGFSASSVGGGIPDLPALLAEFQRR